MTHVSVSWGPLAPPSSLGSDSCLKSVDTEFKSYNFRSRSPFDSKVLKSKFLKNECIFWYRKNWDHRKQLPPRPVLPRFLHPNAAFSRCVGVDRPSRSARGSEGARAMDTAEAPGAEGTLPSTGPLTPEGIRSQLGTGAQCRWSCCRREAGT